MLPVPTRKVAKETPVPPDITHGERIENESTGIKSEQPVSVARKPVPETVTVVPGSNPVGGKPAAGLTVTAAVGL
jgi:hypothetical protein